MSCDVGKFKRRFDGSIVKDGRPSKLHCDTKDKFMPNRMEGTDTS